MDRNRGESSFPLFTHKGMSSIEPHRTSSSHKHSLGEKSLPRKKKVHYAADTEEDLDQSSDLSDMDQEQSELSDSSKADDSQSDNTSTSSVLGSRHLATITRDVNFNTIIWPWLHKIYKCSYDNWAQPDYDPTDALFASVSVAADPQVLGQTNHPLLHSQSPILLLQPNGVNCPLFKDRIEHYKEYLGRANQWHNGNGKGYFTALFKLLLYGVVNCPSVYLM